MAPDHLLDLARRLPSAVHRVLLVELQQLTQGADLGAVGPSPGRCHRNDRARLSSSRLLVHGDEARIGQNRKVSVQVAVGEFERLLELDKADDVGVLQHGQDPESHALVDYVVDVCDRVRCLVHENP